MTSTTNMTQRMTRNIILEAMINMVRFLLFMLLVYLWHGMFLDDKKYDDKKDYHGYKKDDHDHNKYPRGDDYKHGAFFTALSISLISHWWCIFTRYLTDHKKYDHKKHDSDDKKHYPRGDDYKYGMSIKSPFFTVLAANSACRW